MSFDNHHLNWNKREWVMQSFTRRIREHPGMIVHGIYRPTHDALHREIAPIRPITKALAIISLTHLMGTQVNDGREGAILQADFLWGIAQQDSELGDEAYKYAQHLEWQIEFLGLGKEAA